MHNGTFASNSWLKFVDCMFVFCSVCVCVAYERLTAGTPKTALDQAIEESDLSSIADTMKEWEVSELTTALGVTGSDVHRGISTDAPR